MKKRKTRKKMKKRKVKTKTKKSRGRHEALNRLSYPTYVGIQYWQKSYSFGISIF